MKKQNFAEAEALARAILDNIETSQEEDSLQTAQVVDALVRSIVGRKKQIDEESRSLIARSLSIREKMLGPENPKVAQSLFNFSSLFWRTGDYAGAKQFVERAIGIAENAYGPDHGEVGKLLHSYAMLHQKTGEFDKARGLFEKALKIEEKELGPEHSVVDNILNSLGLLYHETGELAKARDCFERTLAIRKKVLGSDHKMVAFASDNLGMVLHSMGDYAEAKNLFENSLAILEKTTNPEHPDFATHLELHGWLLKDLGEYTKAMPFLEKALAIKEKAFGANHPAVADSLNRLAVVQRHTGDYKRAKALLERCITIYEEVFGPEHPRTAVPLNNLANVLDNMGDVEGAEALIKRAFEIQEKALGAQNVNLVTYLANYAGELQRIGKFEKAMELQQRALGILEKNFGPDHPDIAQILINLADLNYSEGECKKAISLIDRALAITEKSVGFYHLTMAKILRDFSEYLWHEDERPEALEKALRSEEIIRDHLRLLTKSGSERQALAFASAKAFYSLDICLSMAVESSEDIEGAVDKVWDAIIRSRALVLDEMAMRHRTIVKIDDPEVADLAESLASARQHLADLVVHGPSSDTTEQNYRNFLDKARKKKEQAERELAKVSSSFREQLEENNVGLAEVKASLPPGFALVAFVHYYHNKFSAEEEQISSYLAFVLRAQRDEPIIVPLGKAEEIEPLIFDWRQEAARGTRIPGRSVKESEAVYRASGEALRQKVWDPIAPYLGQTDRVLLVPDGDFYVVDFASLPIGSDKYLVEEGPILHYLSAERDLICSKASTARGTGLLALGDPTFDDPSFFAALSPESKPKAGILAKAKSLLPFRGMHSECGDFKSLEFDPLPATHKEINEISAIWKNYKRKESEILQFVGTMANERALKQTAPGKQFLHIATHGFFLEATCPSALAHVERRQESYRKDTDEFLSVTGENPLLLSGLALAGANHREAAGADEEDGILTAEEVATLDLSGVDLVTLSACGTGGGMVMSGEGVFGLRRAFRIAGAQRLITSLWAVEDEAARKWMRTFYEALFSKGLQTADAVREASLGLLQELSKKSESTHPFYWAGFVASGDWR